MHVEQATPFRRALKKLYDAQKLELDDAVRLIMNNPTIGVSKAGNLSGVRVYKFHMVKQLTLLAYSYDETSDTIYLIDVGSHENFYRDLKK